MRRRLLQLAVALGALALSQTSCSLVVNLQADCDGVADCGAYTCDDQNVACRQDCAAQSECASGFVCDLNQNRCEGGFCTARSAAFSLGEPVVNFRAAETLLAAPEGAALQLVVLAGQSEGMGMKRYYLPSYRSAADATDEVLNAMRIDFPLTGTLQLASSHQDPTQGLARFVWAQQSDTGGVRSVLLNAKTPWISATETIYNLPPATVLSQLTATAVEGGTLLGWVEAAGATTRPVTQFMQEDGTTRMAQPLDTDGYAIVLAHDALHRTAYWLQRRGSWWGIWSREAAHGQPFDTDVPPRLIESGSGLAPNAIFAANGREGTLLFTEKTNAFGAKVYELLRVQNGNAQQRGIPYADGFDEIERLRVVPSPRKGAWVAIVGAWSGEKGVWLRYIDGDGVADRYPVRVLDEPRDKTIDQLSVSEVAGSLQVSWAERDDATPQRELWTRSFFCE